MRGREMHTFLKYALRLAVICMMALLSSCLRRHLDLAMTNGASVKVIAHWDSTALRPEGMTVMFFPQDGGTPYVKLSNSDTAVVFLPKGTYNMLVFNETVTDFENVRFSSTDNCSGMYAYTVPGTGSFYDNVREIPEKLASYYEEDIVITEEMAGHTIYYPRGSDPPDVLPWEDMEIHAIPRIITCTIQLKVWIDNTIKLASAGGFLCHFSSGVRMAGGKPLKEEASYKVSFEDLVETGDNKGYLYKEFCGFGFYDGVSEPLEGYSFDFFAVIADGSGYRERRFIDNNITWYYGPYHELFIVIEIRPDIKIPDVSGDQSWNIGVDEWNNEDIYVILD